MHLLAFACFTGLFFWLSLKSKEKYLFHRFPTWSISPGGGGTDQINLLEGGNSKIVTLNLLSICFKKWSYWLKIKINAKFWSKILIKKISLVLLNFLNVPRQKFKIEANQSKYMYNLSLKLCWHFFLLFIKITIFFLINVFNSFKLLLIDYLMNRSYILIGFDICQVKKFLHLSYLKIKPLLNIFNLKLVWNI